MRRMPIRSSNRVSLIAIASFVFALGAAVGPAERQAFAQKPPASSPKKSEPSTPSSDASTTDSKNDGKKEGELDTSVESKKAIYISGDFAATRADLGGISDKSGLDKTVANGILYGLGAGLRLKDIRLGARWRVYDTTEFQLWTLALSAGYGLPLRPVSPVFSAHVGYVFDQHVEEALFKSALPPGTLLPPNVDLKGILAGIDINASYWVSQFLRVGLFIGADAMFLSREKANLPRSIVGNAPDLAQHPLYKDSGSSIGLNFNIGLRGAFDIAFK